MTQYLMIEKRERTTVATPGSQRRVYDGCAHPDDWEESWTPWEWLDLKLTPEEAERRLIFWQELNTYAVSQRGPSAQTEFRIVPDTVYDGTW